MVVDLNSKPHSLTHIANMSYDEDNQLSVREIVGDDGTGTIRKAKVDSSGAIYTTASSLPLPTGAATSANQTSGGQKTQIVDSGGTNLGTTTNPVAVQPPASGALPVSGTVTANPTMYGTKIDTASATVTYIGEAAAGSATSSAVWRIKKLDTSSIALSTTWADGDTNFNNIWDNRASLSYS